MGMPGLVRFTQGYLRLQLSGPAVVRFVQAAAHEGIEFWDLRFADHGYEAYLSARDFMLLRPLARRTRTRVRIAERRGLPFRWQKPARQAALFGLVFFVGLIYLMGSFVWRIEVSGLMGTPEEVFLHALDQSGLRVGQPSRWIDIPAVEGELLARSANLSWVGIEIKGIVARVTVVEKSTRDDLVLEMLPADVVAAKDGLIEVLVVLQGRAAVAEGHHVKAGQVLIAGSGGQGAIAPGSAIPVTAGGTRARGIVKARVNYEITAEAPLVRVTIAPTGATYQRAVLRIGSRDIILSGKEEVPFELYEETRDSLTWRGGRGEVLAELTSITYHELERIEEHLGPAGARLEAEAVARDQLGRRLVPGAVMLSEQLSEYFTADSVGIRLQVQAIEDIGLTRIRGSPAP